MVSRHADWLKQGQRDLDLAQRALETGHYEWACFAAQQGAEKAAKAAWQWLGATARGHAVAALLEALPEPHRPDPALIDIAKELDKHYIPPRYPNAHPQGAPYESYTRGEAERAIDQAGRVVAFCAHLLAGPRGGGEPSARGG